MNRYDASGSEPVLCARCDKCIEPDAWFARIRVGERWIAFCRPWCVEKFYETRSESLRRIEMAAQNGELPLPIEPETAKQQNYGACRQQGSDLQPLGRFA